MTGDRFFFYEHGSRSASVAMGLLKDFTGAIQSDGYIVYEHSMGRNPSGTSALAYFRFHQKYWCSGMPFSFNRALIAVPFSRGLALDLFDLFACKHVS